MSDVFERYMDQKFPSIEGESGVRNLNKMLESMGYGQGWERGRAMEEFFADNPSAIEAVLLFIEQHIDSAPEWQQGLQEELIEDECHEGDDDFALEEEEWSAETADFNDLGSRHHY